MRTISGSKWLAGALACALLFVLMTSRTGWAWHRSGHYACALVAWKRLKETGEHEKISQLLRRHPHCELFLDAERPPGVDADEWRFVRAAQWPDWVAQPTGRELSEEQAAAIVRDYHRQSWHFVNLPYFHPDEESRKGESELREAALWPGLTPKGEPRHILAAIDVMSREYRDEELSLKRRAVALAWLMHLAADVHQPLHCCSLIATSKVVGPEEFAPPSGDRGGNRLAVRVSPTDLNSATLHAVWDGYYLRQHSYGELRDEVNGWYATHGDHPAKGESGDPWNWAKESFEIAQTDVYHDGDRWLQAAPLPPDSDSAKLREIDAPALSKQYLEKVERISRERLWLAGRRLAELLEAKQDAEDSK